MLSKRGLLWLRLGRTLNLDLGCFGMGLVMSLTGVALLDLVEIYESDVKTVSHLITTRCVAGLVGSLLGGKLYDTFNTQVMSILTMMTAFVSVLMIPISGNLALAHFVVFVGGVGFGAFDTGANVWIIKLWPRNSSPALQVFHLSFGIGCLVAPLIAEPFLSTIPTDDEPVPDNSLVFNESSYFYNQANLTDQSNQTLNSTHLESSVYYAFGIASAFHLLPMISMIVLYCIDDSDFKPPKKSLEVAMDKEEVAEDVRFNRILLALLAAYVCVYVALECSCGQMITAYAVKCDLHLAKPTASRIAAVYFLSFAVSRVIAAVIAIRVTSFQLLVGSHVILAVTAVLLLSWGNSSEAVLWAGSALLGLGQGPIYGAAVAWAVSYMNMSNGMMSLIIVSSGVGAMAPSLLVGQFLEYNPSVFLYVCFVTVVLCIVVFLAMFLFVRKRPMLSIVKNSCVNGDAVKKDDSSLH
ncbi:unnamed protein product [Ixodes hexagonus]